MTLSSSSSPGPNVRGAIRRAGGSLPGVLAPFAVAVLVWILAAPRSELVSVGDGRGIRLADSGADGGTQLLVMVILLGFATVCAVLVLWHRHPGLRSPGGVVTLTVVPGLVCVLAAAAATPVAGLVASPSPDVPYGEVVAQAPAVGELFYDRMIYGTSGPSWDWFPPGTGWLLWGAMIALFTVAALAHFSDPPDPVAEGSRTGP